MEQLAWWITKNLLRYSECQALLPVPALEAVGVVYEEPNATVPALAVLSVVDEEPSAPVPAHEAVGTVDEEPSVPGRDDVVHDTLA